VVLEKEVVFVGNTSDPAEDWTFHEFIDIRAEAVNDLEIVSRSRGTD